MSELRSLTTRLFVRYALMLLLVWVCLFALAVFEFFRSGQEEIDLELKNGVQQLLAVMRVLSDSPEQMRETATEIAKFDSPHEAGDDGLDVRIHFQVWLGDKLIYGDNEVAPTDSVGTEALARETLTDANGEHWIAWSAVDASTNTKTRLLMHDPISIAVSEGDLGFLVLPLLVSMPFLLIPTWLVTRRSMGPLTSIGEEIDLRDELDLSLLSSDSKYRELEPIVKAINRLMVRLNDRLAREKEFLSDAAHELKTPLAVIKAQSERISSMVEQSESDNVAKTDIASAISGLSQGVDRATHAIGQLISYSRLDAGHLNNALVDTNIGDFVAERLAMLDGIASARCVELVLHCGETVSRKVDRNALAAMVDNLTSNALKHAPQHTTIDVSVSTTNDEAVILIDDSGPGIPVEQRAKVFERFYRLPDSPAEGSGLGLGIAERAARLLGGSIELSTPGNGCGLRVIVKLPA